MTHHSKVIYTQQKQFIPVIKMYENHLVDGKEIATIPGGRMMSRYSGDAMRWLDIQ